MATLQVAYQGVPGAYSEAAALEFFGDNVELVPCANFDELFSVLQQRKASQAVLPIENSLAGTIHSNLDLLIAHPTVHIIGELDFRVRHCLIGKPNSGGIEHVRHVYSHPMALAQCERYLSEHSMQPINNFDTAGSAEMLSRNELGANAAAIASSRTAKLYSLEVLEADIEDEQDNYTRFLILSVTADPSLGVLDTNECDSKVEYKTSVVFTLNNHPGALCKALSVFMLLDVDLTKIESRHLHPLLVSRPDISSTLARRWGYVFYVDVAANYAHAPVRQAFDLLRNLTYVFYGRTSVARNEKHISFTHEGLSHLLCYLSF